MEQIEYDSREKLSLLTAQAAEWLPLPGGYQRLTASDIAAILSKVSAGASVLARAKYVDEAYKPRLKIYTAIAWIRTCGIPGRPDMFWKLIDLGIHEVIDPRTCRWCRGIGRMEERKDRKLTGKQLICDSCKGEGRKRLTDHGRARFLRIHHEQFKRKIARLYMEPLTILTSWDGEILKALQFG